MASLEPQEPQDRVYVIDPETGRRVEITFEGQSVSEALAAYDRGEAPAPAREDPEHPSE